MSRKIHKIDNLFRGSQAVVAKVVSTEAVQKQFETSFPEAWDTWRTSPQGSACHRTNQINLSRLNAVIAARVEASFKAGFESGWAARDQ